MLTSRQQSSIAGSLLVVSKIALALRGLQDWHNMAPPGGISFVWVSLLTSHESVDPFASQRRIALFVFAVVEPDLSNIYC